MSKFKELFDRFKTSEIKHKKLIITLVVLVVLLPIVIPIVVFTLIHTKHSYDKYDTKGAIVSNSNPCSEIGIRIMRKYENVIDAMIATMICDGVVTINNMGLGGGFMALIYIKKEQKAYALNARETAPLAATADMYDKNPNSSYIGAIAAGVPGELMGYDAMYKSFGGSAPWKELFEPTIELCRNGITIGARVASNVWICRKEIRNDKGLSAIYVKKDGTLAQKNDQVKMLQMASTLETIANEGVSAFYNGSLSNAFINDIKSNGGIMTLKDLSSYKVRWEEPVTDNISGYRLFSTPPPSSGLFFNFILKVVNGKIRFKSYDIIDVGVITEAFKYAFGFQSKMEDPYYGNLTSLFNDINDPGIIEYIKKKLNTEKTSQDANYYAGNYSVEDHGTANMVALSPNGDAVVVTSSVNSIFGSYFMSASTGILLNSHMDDFSKTGASFNLIKPGARPLSSMCPAVFVEKNGNVRLALGAAGGTRILTGSALVAIENLFKERDIFKSMGMPRYHHKLLPMEWYYDSKMDKGAVEYMKKLGHTVKENNAISVVTAISQIGRSIKAADDFRRPGGISYFVPPN